LLPLAHERAAAQQPKFLVTGERAVLEVEAPNGSTVTVQPLGENPPKVQEKPGSPRHFEVSIPARELCLAEVSIRLPGGEEKRTVLLQSGRRVLLPLRSRDPRPEVVLQTGHSGPVRAVACSRDGKWVLTGSQDRTAILWEAASGRQVRTFTAPGPIHAVAISTDCKRVAASTPLAGAVVWDMESGKTVELPGDRPLKALAFSPDGRSIVTGGADGVTVWDAQSATRGRVLAGTRDVTALAFSPDGKRLAVGGKTGAAIWDWPGGEKHHALRSNLRDVTGVAWSPDGKHIALAGEDPTAVLFDAATGTPAENLAGEDDLKHTGALTAVAWSPDGKWVLTGSTDRTALLWDATSRECKFVLGKESTHGMVLAVAFDAESKYAVTGCQDGTTTLWDTTTGKERRTLQGSRNVVTAVVVSPDGKRLLTTSQSHAALLWDTNSGQLNRVLAHGAEVHTAAFSADGAHALTGGADGNVVLWDVAAGTKVHSFAGAAGPIRAVAFSPDGRRIFAGTESGNAILWDAAGTEVARLAQHKSAVSAVAFGPDSKTLVTGSRDRTALLWELKGGAYREPRVLQHANPVSAVAFAADGRSILSTALDGVARLWDAAGKPLKSFAALNSSILSASLSPDGRLAAAGLEDGRVVLWQTSTGQKLHTFRGHTGPALAVAFSQPDARFVLSGGTDNTARLWDIGTGDELTCLIGLNKGADWLAVTPDGLFDGSSGGREKVSYRVGGGLNVVPVDRFFNDFYRSGLLAGLWKGEPPTSDTRLGQKLPPKVRILLPRQDGASDASHVNLEVEAEDQGGGVQGPWLFHNDKRVLAPGKAEKQGKTIRRRFTVALVEGENCLRVQAATADGSWESEPAEVRLRFEKPLDKPELYVLVVGVSKYEHGNLRLKFAERDARALADLFRKRGGALYKEMHITELIDEQVTRKGVEGALEKMAMQAKPQDTLLVFLAGHGAMVGQRYYFLPQDFQMKPGDKLDDALRAQGMPADVLGDFLLKGAALKRLLLLDTCASGGAVDLFQVSSRNGFAFRGEIESLSRSKGLHILAAAAATEEAKEVAELGHGVLTYTLLAGLGAVKQGPLANRPIQPSSPEGVVSLSEWFTYAQGHVPRLTKEYCGAEQNVHMSVKGASFPLLPLKER
jgi:WD40 repeat protein